MIYGDVLVRCGPLLLKGAVMTLQVVAVTAFLSLIFGLIFGIFSSQRLRVPGASAVIEVFTFVLRAVPFYVQLLIVYFVIPELLGYHIEPFAASVWALGMCSAGYVAQIVRGGINSIPDSQWEAAFAVGLSYQQTLRLIILPQVIRHILPAINNELDSLLKSTSVVSSIGMLELTRMGMNAVSREMEPVPIYLAVAGLYLVMSAVFNAVTRLLEKRISYVRS